MCFATHLFKVLHLKSGLQQMGIKCPNSGHLWCIYSSTFENGNRCLMFFFPAQKLETTNTKTVTHVVPQRLFIHSGESQDPCHRFQVQILSLRSAKFLQINVAAVHFFPQKKKKTPSLFLDLLSKPPTGTSKKRVRGAGFWFLKVSKLMSCRLEPVKPGSDLKRDGSLHRFLLPWTCTMFDDDDDEEEEEQHDEEEENEKTNYPCKSLKACLQQKNCQH